MKTDTLKKEYSRYGYIYSYFEWQNKFMFIKKVTLTNFRGYENETFEFKEKFSVLSGENGSGKTAALEAICVALGGWLYAFDGVESKDKRNIYDIDKRVISAKINSAPLIQIPVEVFCEGEINNKTISWSRGITSRKGHTTYGGLGEIRSIAKEINEKIYNNKDLDIVLPMIAYYSSARLWNEPIQRGGQLKKEKIRLEGYKKAISNSNSIKDAMNYINKLAYLSDQDSDSKIKLDTILLAIQKSISSISENSSVNYNKKMGQICVTDSFGNTILYSRLSDGYRCIISLVTDICIRMAMLNPQLTNESILETDGVVLIDEIDLHLHPNWQKVVVGDLKNIFPNLQFIVTTHSPFIIQSLKQGELISLSAVGDEEYEDESIEDIAENVMKVNNPQFSKYKEKMYQDSKEYYEKLRSVSNKDELTSLKTELELLSAKYGDNVAYYAFIEQKYLDKKIELEKLNETGR